MIRLVLAFTRMRKIDRVPQKQMEGPAPLVQLLARLKMSYDRMDQDSVLRERAVVLRDRRDLSRLKEWYRRNGEAMRLLVDEDRLVVALPAPSPRSATPAQRLSSSSYRSSPAPSRPAERTRGAQASAERVRTLEAHVRTLERDAATTRAVAEDRVRELERDAATTRAAEDRVRELERTVTAARAVVDDRVREIEGTAATARAAAAKRIQALEAQVLAMRTASEETVRRATDVSAQLRIEKDTLVREKALMETEFERRQREAEKAAQLRLDALQVRVRVADTSKEEAVQDLEAHVDELARRAAAHKSETEAQLVALRVERDAALDQVSDLCARLQIAKTEVEDAVKGAAENAAVLSEVRAQLCIVESERDGAQAVLRATETKAREANEKNEQLVREGSIFLDEMQKDLYHDGDTVYNTEDATRLAADLHTQLEPHHDA